jgi:hypothetical protein
MAYLRDLPERKCFSCRKRASVELFNRANGSHGLFCRRCGAARLKNLLASEALIIARDSNVTNSQEGDEVR